MNLLLKAVYFCATNQHRWGKGYTVAEAKKNAGIRTKAQEKAVEYYVNAAIFDNPTEDELKNLHQCITADQMDGNARYYDADRTEEDTEMINAKHVGWLLVEKNFKSE